MRLSLTFLTDKIPDSSIVKEGFILAQGLRKCNFMEEMCDGGSHSCGCHVACFPLTADQEKQGPQVTPTQL